MAVKHRRAATVSKETYVNQQRFGLPLRSFLRFSETAARRVGLTPQQYQGLLAHPRLPWT